MEEIEIMENMETVDEAAENTEEKSDFGALIVGAAVIGIAGFITYKAIRKICSKMKSTKKNPSESGVLECEFTDVSDEDENESEEEPDKAE